MNTPLKTFICYAHEDREVVDDMRQHLTLYQKNKLLDIWYDGQILAGEKWDDSIKDALKTADIVLMFISVKFINSDYIENTELQDALARHRADETTLIPIIVSSCDWEEYFQIGRFQALPNQAKPILSRHFPHKADAYHEVAVGIKQTALSLLEKKRAKLEKEADEKAILAQKQQLEAEKAEKSRSRRDEAAWKKTEADLEKTAIPEQKIAILNLYLSLDEHQNHRVEAEEILDHLEGELNLARKAEAKRQEDIQKQKAAEQLKAEQEKARKKEAEEKARQKDLPEMVFVQGGTFQLGEKDIAEPVHAVTLSNFEIGKYPVTQKLWKAIMGANPSHFKGDDLPVENVSWDDCQNFIKKLNEKTGKKYRLPTEAEWEFAARGSLQSKGYLYAGSNDLKEVGWFWENSGDQPLSGEWKIDLLTKNNCRTWPVGQKKANELGIYDMSGNVWEWCEDWYAAYSSSDQTDPKGPDKGSARVNRGGSWNNDAQRCRVAYRYLNSPEYRSNYIGFRLASSPQ